MLNKFNYIKTKKSPSRSSLENRIKKNHIKINVDSSIVPERNVLGNSFENRRGTMDYPSPEKLPNIRASLENDPTPTILASSIPVIDQECLYALDDSSPSVLFLILI